jgi:hypothetical protein
MSFYSLGMSPLSPLRRQFSPPIVRSLLSDPPSDEDVEEHRDITRDSKDVLVQRLNELAERLSRQNHVKDQIINVLHTKVDELEDVLRATSYSSKNKKKTRSLSTRSDERDGSDFSGEAPHPAELLLSDVSSLSSPTRASPSAKTEIGHGGNPKAERRDSRMTVAQAERVIAEAQNLHKDLETVISNLRDRQEETEASSLPLSTHTQ